MKVYRLVIDYPEGSHDDQGVPVEDWEPNGWVPEGAHDPEEGPRPFRWPRNRAYLSRAGADHRAMLFREWGASVQVQASRPVEWDEREEPAP